MLLEWENNSGKLQIISRKFQNSGKFQNNAINDVKQISLSYVIRALVYSMHPESQLQNQSSTRILQNGSSEKFRKINMITIEPDF